MDAWILVVLPTGVTLPRKAEVALEVGNGRVAFEGPPIDEAFRASVDAAWRAALRLADRTGVDARVRVRGVAPLAGPSAGLPLGLAMLSLLAEATPAAHLATGAVADEDGYLAGGAEIASKAEAAAALGTPALLLAPPIVAPPRVEGVRIVPCASLADAFARVAPQAYEGMRARHEALQRAGVPQEEGERLLVEPGRATFVRDGRARWRVRLAGPPDEAALRDILARARSAVVLG